MQTKSTNIFLTLRFVGVMFLYVVLLSSCKKDPDPVPKPEANFTFVSVDVPTGKKVTFTNTSKNAVSYSWSFGVPGATSTATSPDYTYVTSGAYKVILTATSADGSTNKKEQTLAITVTIGETALLKNSNFANADSWTVLTTDGIEVKNIVTTFNDKLTLSVPALDEEYIVVQQLVQLEIGDYELDVDLDIAQDAFNHEVALYLSKTAIVAEGTPPADGDLVIQFSAGECTGVDAYSGSLLAIPPSGCLFVKEGATAIDGMVSIGAGEAGAYYFQIYTGVWGGNFGSSFHIKSARITKK